MKSENSKRITNTANEVKRRNATVTTQITKLIMLKYLFYICFQPKTAD